jgi:peptidyl-prolyl cis-trans isomerase A (cyclophilin A)
VLRTCSLLILACACSSGGGDPSPGAGGAGGSSGSGGTAGGAGGASAKPVVELETSLGTMAIELEPDKMPITTDNFLAYVDDGFYAGTIFHRVVPNFVIQGGGFESGMLQKSTSAPIPLETHPDLTHVYGAVSMARTTNPDSATSQFFIVNAASGAPHLDGEYAAFGKLVEGSSVLDAISLVRTTIYDVPLEDVFVLAARRR